MYKEVCEVTTQCGSTISVYVDCGEVCLEVNTYDYERDTVHLSDEQSKQLIDALAEARKLIQQK